MSAGGMESGKSQQEEGGGQPGNAFQLRLARLIDEFFKGFVLIQFPGKHMNSLTDCETLGAANDSLVVASMLVFSFILASSHLYFHICLIYGQTFWSRSRDVNIFGQLYDASRS